MTFEQAKEDLGDIDSFCHQVCVCCTANDAFCPSECDDLQKARQLDFDRLVKCYARNGGDLVAVIRYIKSTKINRKKGGY